MPVVSVGEITIVDVNDGLDASLSSPSWVLPADNAGTVAAGDYANASTTLTIREAGVDTTPRWTFYISATGGGISYRDSDDSADRTGTGPTNGLLSGTPGFVRVASLSQDLSWLDITATKGTETVTRRFSVAKARAGGTGVRGTITASRAVAGTVWSDTEAAAAISAAGGGSPITGDVVTLYNNTAAFSQTRVRASNGTWTQLLAFFGGDVIVNGTIGSSKIAANAITTDRLLVTGRNNAINDDPSFRDDSAWALDSGNGSYTVNNGSDPTAPYYSAGFRVLRATNDVRFASRSIPAVPGRQYKVSAWLRRISGAGSGFIRVFFRNSAGTLLSPITATKIDDTGNLDNINYTDTWTKYTGKITAPATAESAKLTIYVNWQTIGVTDVADARIEEYIGSDLIVDGAITATKLSANSIAVGTAAIQNGAITNAMIGDMSATKLTAGYANAVDLEAGTIFGSELYIGGTPTYATIDHDGSPVTVPIINSIESVANPNIALTAAGAEFDINFFKIKQGATGTAETVFQVVDGVTYIKKAMIQKIVADDIDSRGLSIKDSNGNIILAAGSPLSSTNITADSGWLNSNITLSEDTPGSISINNAGGGSVTTITANNKLSSTNVSTYISSGAIAEAYIGDLSAGKITTGTLNADRIAVGTATANAATLQTYTSSAFSLDQTATPAIYTLFSTAVTLTNVAQNTRIYVSVYVVLNVGAYSTTANRLYTGATIQVAWLQPSVGTWSSWVDTDIFGNNLCIAETFTSATGTIRNFYGQTIHISGIIKFGSPSSFPQMEKNGSVRFRVKRTEEFRAANSTTTVTGNAFNSITGLYNLARDEFTTIMNTALELRV